MQFALQALISSLTGCGITLAITKYFILRALNKLDDLSDKILKIDIQLASILVRLEQLPEHSTILKEHEKKINYLQAVGGK